MSKHIQRAVAYRIRQFSLQWFVLKLDKNDQLVSSLGPYKFEQAKEEAEKLGLPNRDNG